MKNLVSTVYGKLKIVLPEISHYYPAPLKIMKTTGNRHSNRCSKSRCSTGIKSIMITYEGVRF